MKKRIISVLLASSMLTGSFVIPVMGGFSEESYEEEEGALQEIFMEDISSEDDLTDVEESLFEDTEEEVLIELPEEETDIQEETALFPEEDLVLSEDLTAVDLTPVGETLSEETEESTLTEGEPLTDLLEEAEEWGGYAFAGYLEDGIPNFIWEGNGEPSTIGHEVILSGEDGSDVSKAGLSAASPDEDRLFSSALFDEQMDIIESAEETDVPLLGAPPAADGGNYFINTKKRPSYHGYARMSDLQPVAYGDGLHTLADGTVRAYRSGRYFCDGGFALDGKQYYADEEGRLIKGWLKTCGDTSVTNAESVADDWKFTYRFFDRTTCERLSGYHKVDSIWHYFEENGAMLRNSNVILNGNYYYSDDYGVCEQVKLRFGNVILSESKQNNDAYLAKNSVTAVDIETFTGQKGEYTFRPRWFNGITSLELFGFEPFETPNAYYCDLRNDTLKGRIGCVYRNVGTYQGREIDLRLTVTDYDLFSLNGDTEVGYFYVTKNAIGLNACNVQSITADMEFLDHQTKKPVSLKGYATFADIDISQSLSILSPVDEVYVDKNCMLYKDPAGMTFQAPFDSERSGLLVNDDDPEYWVQVNYTGSHLKFKMGSAFEQFVFAESGTDIAGVARLLWNETYTGNPGDYSITKSDGNFIQTWQGIYYKRLGRISIPPVSKTVSDTDEKDVTENRLGEEERTYDYTLHHNVPAETEEFYYTAYQVTDDFEEGLSVLQDGIRVTNDAGEDVTDRFEIKVDGRKVVFTAKEEILPQASFYDNIYHYHVPVKIEDVEALPRKDGDDYLIYNQCTAQFDRPFGAEKSDSNRTATRVKEPFQFGSITITKRIAADEIVWAHGNPTFMFSAEGTDARNVHHRYEEFLCFEEQDLTVDQNGMAVLSVTISHVPLGTYNVCEMDVMDYDLTGAEAQTPNMRITKAGEPGRGKDPAFVMYGTCSLTGDQPDAGITFTDSKGDWHGYRHTDVVRNAIPIRFG